jgi:hypothetical protein
VGGALLTVILHGSRLERRKDGRFAGRAYAGSLRRSLGTVGCRAWSAPTPPWPGGPKPRYTA